MEVQTPGLLGYTHTELCIFQGSQIQGENLSI